MMSMMSWRSTARCRGAAHAPVVEGRGVDLQAAVEPARDLLTRELQVRHFVQDVQDPLRVVDEAGGVDLLAAEERLDGSVVQALARRFVAVQVRAAQALVVPAEPGRVAHGLEFDAESQVVPDERPGADHALRRRRVACPEGVHGVPGACAVRPRLRVDDLLGDDHGVGVGHEVVEGRGRLGCLDLDRVVVDLLHRVDRRVLAGAVVVGALVAVRIALALVAVDHVIGGKLATGEVREVAADLVRIVELDALAQLDDVGQKVRRGLNHLRC